MDAMDATINEKSLTWHGLGGSFVAGAANHQLAAGCSDSHCRRRKSLVGRELQ
jgi:hypothetical protein